MYYHSPYSKQMLVLLVKKKKVVCACFVLCVCVCARARDVKECMGSHTPSKIIGSRVVWGKMASQDLRIVRILLVGDCKVEG